MNRNKGVIKQTVAQLVMATLRSDDPFIFDRWKAVNFIASGTSLKFNVKTDNFSGEVIVALNTTNKKFLITFATIEKGKRKVHNRIMDIELDNMLPSLKNYLEEKKE